MEIHFEEWLCRLGGWKDGVTSPLHRLRRSPVDIVEQPAKPVVRCCASAGFRHLSIAFGTCNWGVMRNFAEAASP